MQCCVSLDLTYGRRKRDGLSKGYRGHFFVRPVLVYDSVLLKLVSEGLDGPGGDETWRVRCKIPPSVPDSDSVHRIESIHSPSRHRIRNAGHATHTNNGCETSALEISTQLELFPSHVIEASKVQIVDFCDQSCFHYVQVEVVLNHVQSHIRIFQQCCSAS